MTIEEFFSTIGTWLTDFVMSFGFKLIGAILVLVIGLKSVKWILKLIRKTKKFETIDPGAETFIISFLGIALRLIVILTAVAILGVPMTNFITILGSAGLAVGLALQGSLSNLAGGLMILLFHPFGIGDFIDSAGVSGTVQEINILYTVLNTPDNIRIVVPNGSLSNATVKNYSVNDTRRVDLEFGVSYKSDLKQVISVLQEMGASHELVLKDKDVFVKISSYDESQITIKLRVWVNASDYWTVYFDLTEKAKEVFDANDIEIPFPQLDVHFDKEKD
ncbi:MAG: mechanosensitive ion channel [Ruminococcaceae bacterium]|nr:mechanosensitive ion channel [Oscillospiraceae bacterium]